jgi:hypothetical protein
VMVWTLYAVSSVGGAAVDRLANSGLLGSG